MAVELVKEPNKTPLNNMSVPKKNNTSLTRKSKNFKKNLSNRELLSEVLKVIFTEENLGYKYDPKFIPKKSNMPKTKKLHNQIKKSKKTTNEPQLTSANSAELLRKLGYSVQENIYQADQSKVNDLKGIIINPTKSLQEYEERKRTLTTAFQTISDVEIVEELSKRITKQDINLSLYPHQEHLFITAKDTTKQVSLPLPIEIKA